MIYFAENMNILKNKNAIIILCRLNNWISLEMLDFCYFIHNLIQIPS